ncbi:MAG: hypothetical protein RL318_1687 [Fibrobacterota bacterium]
MPVEPELCPCGSRKALNLCCGPFLAGTALPQLPEQLMRSRFAAFRTGLVEYLLETTHPLSRRIDDRTEIEATIRDTVWKGLKILSAPDPDEELGYVEFVAFFGNGPQQLRERSEFHRLQGRWYYVKGRHLPPVPLERNGPCFCGSGNKLKKCCG